jgi:hypothetical protein
MHPLRAGRRPQQSGRQGRSPPRWMGGGKRGVRLKQCGGIVGGACATANGAAHPFQGRRRQGDGRMLVWSETAGHAAEGEPANLTRCPRGAGEDRRRVETGLSRLTVVCPFKKVMHRVWAYGQARLAFTMAVCNILVQGHGFQPHASGCVPLSRAEFGL